MGTAGVGRRIGLGVMLALAACSDSGGADPAAGGMPGTDDSGGASEGDEGDDAAPDPDDGAVDDGDASGTRAAGDDGGSDGPDPGASAWCLYKVVADAA